LSAEIKLLLDIAVLLLFAKLLGEVAERLKVDSIVGEMIGGLVAGPVLGLVSPSPALSALSTIGIIMLMFLMGISTRFDEVKDSIWKGSTLGLTTALAALGGGLLLGIFAFDSLLGGAVLGVALMGSSTAIPIKILLKTGSIRTKAGQMIFAMSMSDDVPTILAITLLSTWVATGVFNLQGATLLGLGMLGFFLIVLTAGSRISDKVLSLISKMKDENVFLTLPLAGVFGLAWAAQSIGIAALSGAFLAGMAMAKSVFAKPVIEPKTQVLGYGFFVPLFFAHSAIIVDLNGIFGWLWIVGALFIAGGITKGLAAAVLSRRMGFGGRDSTVIGISTLPRAEFGLIAGQLALVFGAIASQIYSAIAFFVLISVVLTPVLLKLYERR
jgi:Kef-type K+ transport system membrane component KefB